MWWYRADRARIVVGQDSLNVIKRSRSHTGIGVVRVPIASLNEGAADAAAIELRSALAGSASPTVLLAPSIVHVDQAEPAPGIVADGEWMNMSLADLTRKGVAVGDYEWRVQVFGPASNALVCGAKADVLQHLRRWQATSRLRVHTIGPLLTALIEAHHRRSHDMQVYALADESASNWILLRGDALLAAGTLMLGEQGLVALRSELRRLAVGAGVSDASVLVWQLPPDGGSRAQPATAHAQKLNGFEGLVSQLCLQEIE